MKLTLGESLIGADSLERGTGREQAAYIVSARREQQGKSAVSAKAVRTGLKSIGGITQKRGTQGTGSRDENSPWAQASLAEAEQFQVQIITPEEEERIAAEQAAAAAATGPLFKVDGCSRRVRSLADDPLRIIGRDESLDVPYSWWRNWWNTQPAKLRQKSKRETCGLVGYVDSFTFGDGKTEPAYLLSAGEWGIYAMRTDDVIKLLPARLRKEEEPVDESGRVPLLAISWWDEKHKKVVLSNHASKWETRYPRSPGGKNFMAYADGGKLLPRQRRTKAKFTGDGGRYGFGVMMTKDADGELHGHRMKPFNYSSTSLIGMKTYRKRERAELARVADFEQGGWGNEGLGVSEATEELPGGRYQIRYGESWPEELKAACATAHDGLDANTCVTDLMDHVVAQSELAFANTPYANSFVIFHDALVQWWEQDDSKTGEMGAQTYLREVLGIGLERQLHIYEGDEETGADERVAKRYVGKLVGDRPELCPLDSNLFADYETAMRQNLAHTYILPHDHPEKFLSGTPDQVQELMERTWDWDGTLTGGKGSPTSARIVEDILRFPKAVAAIVAAKGTRLEGANIRSGKRRPRTQPYEYPSCPTAEAIRGRSGTCWTQKARR